MSAPLCCVRLCSTREAAASAVKTRREKKPAANSADVNCARGRREGKKGRRGCCRKSGYNAGRRCRVGKSTTYGRRRFVSEGRSNGARGRKVYVPAPSSNLLPSFRPFFLSLFLSLGSLPLHLSLFSGLFFRLFFYRCCCRCRHCHPFASSARTGVLRTSGHEIWSAQGFITRDI